MKSRRYALTVMNDEESQEPDENAWVAEQRRVVLLLARQSILTWTCTLIAKPTICSQTTRAYLTVNWLTTVSSSEQCFSQTAVPVHFHSPISPWTIFRSNQFPNRLRPFSLLHAWPFYWQRAAPPAATLTRGILRRLRSSFIRCA
jgi:hypothetical protein